MLKYFFSCLRLIFSLFSGYPRFSLFAVPLPPNSADNQGFTVFKLLLDDSDMDTKGIICTYETYIIMWDILTTNEITFQDNRTALYNTIGRGGTRILVTNTILRNNKNSTEIIWIILGDRFLYFSINYFVFLFPVYLIKLLSKNNVMLFSLGSMCRAYDLHVKYQKMK